MIKDLALILRIAVVDNRYTTARSRCSASSVFLFGLSLFLTLALEIVIAKGVLLTPRLFVLLVLGLGRRSTAA